MVEELDDLRKLLHEKDSKEELTSTLKNFHPYDLAQSFNELDPTERQVVYECLSEEDLADIFSYLDEDDAAKYLQEMSFSQGADVLTEMSPDDAVDVLQEFDDKEDAKDFLSQMDESDAKELIELSSHEEDSAGSIMSTDFIKIKSGTDVKDASKILGYEANDKEVIDPLFVVDDQDKLLGVLSLQDLIVARTPKKVDEVMNDNFVYGLLSDDDVTVSKKIRDYDVYALPILTDEGIIKGIVTMDDALDVANDEIVEDYTKMAAVSEEDEDASPIKNVLKRLPWLIILLALSLLISNVTAIFEEVIAKVTVLWFFTTMILGMSGNAGTQGLAVAVRKISRGEIENKKKTFIYILKEFLILIINALLLGIVCFGITLLFIKLLKFDEGINIFYTSLVISLSLSSSLIITGMLGVFIPLLMNKVHIDPAVASGPLITTINDVISMVIYFGFAMLMMSKIVA